MTVNQATPAQDAATVAMAATTPGERFGLFTGYSSGVVDQAHEPAPQLEDGTANHGMETESDTTAAASGDTCAMQMTMPAHSDSMPTNPSSAHTAVDSAAHSAAPPDTSLNTEAADDSYTEQLTQVLEDVLLEEMD